MARCARLAGASASPFLPPFAIAEMASPSTGVKWNNNEIATPKSRRAGANTGRQPFLIRTVSTRQPLQVIRRHPWRALLTLIGVVLVLIAGLFGWSRYHLLAAEKALERYNFRAALDHLELSRATWPQNARSFLIMAQAARRHEQH